MMRIVVTLCPPLDRMMGAERVELELPPSATGNDVIGWIQEQLGDRLPGEGRLILVVNQAFASADTMLTEGDQITIVPRMSCCH